MNKNSNTLPKNGFKVPDNYFDNFDQKLMSRLNVEETHQKQKNNKLIRFKPFKNFRNIAAILVLMLGLGYLVKLNSNINIPNEAIENYFEYNHSYTLSSDILNTFSEEDISELEKSIELNQKEVNDYILTNIDLEYYLNY